MNQLTIRDVSIVLAVVLLASYLPARSAGRVDPMVVLREMTDLHEDPPAHEYGDNGVSF